MGALGPLYVIWPKLDRVKMSIRASKTLPDFDTKTSPKFPNGETMKKLFFALLISAQAFAAEVVVMDIPAVDLRGADSVETRFVVNEAAGTVDARMDASQTFVQCFGGGMGGGYYPYPGGYNRPGPYGRPYNHCVTSVRNVLTMTEEVPGMIVQDKVVSLNGVVCGKMGVSRVLKVPTFFLNGSCKLSDKIVRVNGERRLIVKVTTK